MSVTRTRVTGPVALPDGSPAVEGAKIIFTLRSWDRSADTVIMAGPVEVTITDGDFEVDLVCTDEAARGSLYSVRYLTPSARDRSARGEELGLIALVGPGPVKLAALLSNPAPVPSAPDAIAKVHALVAEAATMVVNAAQVAADRTATEAARDAAMQAAQWDQDVADDGTRLALSDLEDGWQVYQRDTEQVWRWSKGVWQDRGPSPLKAKANTTDVSAGNLITDPYMRLIGREHRVVDGRRPAFLGQANAPDAASPVPGGGSILASGTQQGRRYLALPEGLRVGDTATFTALLSANAPTRFAISFRNASFAVISQHDAPTTFSGDFVDQAVVAQIPAGAVAVEYGVSSAGPAEKTIWGTFAARGLVAPYRAIGSAVATTALNRYPDHLFKLAGAGVSTLDGYNLMGYNAAASIVNAPTESPFKHKCLRLPSATAAHDMRISAARLGLEIGRDLHVTIGYIYAGLVTAEIALYSATNALIGTVVTGYIDGRHPTTNAREYAELRARIPVTATALSEAAYLRIRSFSAGPSVAEALIAGISIADISHQLSDTQPGLDGIAQRAENTVPACVLGRRIAIFGDSIPANTLNAEGGRNWYLHDYMQSHIAAEVLNFAFGGTTMAGRTDPAYDAFSMSALADAIHSGVWTTQDSHIAAMPPPGATRHAALKAVDWSSLSAAVLMFGTNDYGAEQRAIGEDTDTTRATFKGAINNTIAKLLDHAPHLRLMIATPIWRERRTRSFAGTISISGTTLTVTQATVATLAVGDTVLARGVERRLTITALGTGTGGNGTYTVDRPMTLAPVSAHGWNPAENGRDLANAAGYSLEDYAQALREIGARQGIPVIDLGRDLGWGPTNMPHWMEDGVHPNGFRALAELSAYLARRVALAL